VAGEARLKKGDVLGPWTLVKYVASGGNGDVWFVEDGDGQEAALKVLHRVGKADYERFKREAAITRSLTLEAGVLPMIGEPHLPGRQTAEDHAWYAMPRATPLRAALEGEPLDQRVGAIATIAQTLAGLVELLALHHRDIKLANLFVYDGRVVVGDFGLARRPDDESLTAEGKVAGPINQLAPELLAGDHDPDLERVDVYLLAVTLWQIATLRPNPPRGTPISSHAADSVARLLPDEARIDELARMIERATAREPDGRPTLRQFATLLEEWLAARGRTQEAESQYDRLKARYEAAETRRKAVLEWLVATVRTEPVFDRLMYQIEDPDKPSEEVIGLTKGQVGAALGELIDVRVGSLTGEPGGQGFGMSGPRYYSRLFPTALAFLELGNHEEQLRDAAPVANAFLDPVDSITLPADAEFVELPNGIRRTPAETYFQLWLLSAFGYLDMQYLDESGTDRTLLNVHTTIAGQRWLLDLGPP
jgi:hypothetical protein